MVAQLCGKIKAVKIIKAPHPLLKQKALPVGKINAGVQKLIKAMKRTLQEAAEPKGMGLAAPQVGQSLRLILVQKISKRSEEGPLFVFLNPEITKFSKKKELGIEGCLSLPGVFGSVERSRSIKLSALNGKGKRIKMGAAGLFARVIQHEVDHLDGILFTDKVKGKLYTSQELEKAAKNDEAGPPK